MDFSGDPGFSLVSAQAILTKNFFKSLMTEFSSYPVKEEGNWGFNPKAVEFFSKPFVKTQPKAPSLGNSTARGEKERGKCVSALRKENPKRI